MSNDNYTNIYNAFNCLSEAKKSAESALNNFLTLPDVFTKYYSVTSVIFSKAAKLDSSFYSMAQNAVIFYEISTTIIGAVNSFSKDSELASKILKDGQNAVNKVYEAAGYLSPIVTDITDTYLVDPYIDQPPLFDTYNPNSTGIDYPINELSGNIMLIGLY